MSKVLARCGLAAVLLVAVLVLAVYAGRVAMPLSLYAWDENSFAIRALFPADAIIRNPYAPELTNGAFLQLIRTVHAVGASYLPWLRVVNIAAYFGGLAAVFQVGARALPLGQRWSWLLIALVFPYYRFVVTGLPEASYVGVLGVLVLATARLYRARPAIHALAAGALAAVLVLIKPHGIAVVAALGVLVLLDGLAERRPRVTATRSGIFALAFFGVGNAIQWTTGQPGGPVLTFFVGRFYGAALGGGLVAGAVRSGLLNLFAMISLTLLLAGIPLMVGLREIGRRWLRERRAFRLGPNHLAFALLAFSLAATLCMVAIFAMKVAVTRIVVTIRTDPLPADRWRQVVNGRRVSVFERRTP